MDQLGSALRSLRVFHDLSQTEAAEKLHISKSYISEIESGRKEPTLTLLTQYSTVFAVPLSSLLFFAEQMETRPGISIGDVIAPKILRLLDWISEVKPAESIRHKKPPQAEVSKSHKSRNL